MGSFKNLRIELPLVVHCFLGVAIAGQAPSSRNSSLLLLFNCSAWSPHNSSVARGCRLFHVADEEDRYTCLFADDIKNPGTGFDVRKALNCSNHLWVYRNSTDENGPEKRMFLDIPDHVPNICDQCKKPDRHCGLGLRCICHPKECSK